MVTGRICVIGSKLNERLSPSCSAQRNERKNHDGCSDARFHRLSSPVRPALSSRRWRILASTWGTDAAAGAGGGRGGIRLLHLSLPRMSISRRLTMTAESGKLRSCSKASRRARGGGAERNAPCGGFLPENAGFVADRAGGHVRGREPFWRATTRICASSSGQAGGSGAGASTAWRRGDIMLFHKIASAVNRKIDIIYEFP